MIESAASLLAARPAFRRLLHGWKGASDSGRGYYVRLEARLDPVERVLKAMDLTDRYVVSPFDSWDTQQAFESTSLHACVGSA